MCFRGTILVASVLTFSLMTPTVGAQSASSSSAFEVASIKVAAPGITYRPQYGRNIWTTVNAPLQMLLVTAFDVSNYDIVGLPDWYRTEEYTIDAKAEDGVILTPETVRPLLRHLLADRFKLLTHRETAPQKGYALVIAKGGPKMKAGKDGPPSMSALRPGQLHAPSTDMHNFARGLETLVGQAVANETGLIPVLT